MPGDPLRAKFIAENFLEDASLVSSVRNIYAYTGTYKGKRISVMASGMGMPSIGIYSYELYKFYGVESIIRIGSAGSYRDDIKVYDLVIATSSYSDSNYAVAQSGDRKRIQRPDPELTEKLIEAAEKLGVPYHTGRLSCTDVFYAEPDESKLKYLTEDMGCIASEMESFALMHNADVLGKKAACIVTISDSIVSGEETTALERQNSFTGMMKTALEAAVSL